MEPEYAAVSADSKRAFISLQEANAIAALDIEQGVFTSIKGLGFKDHSVSGNGLDMRRDGKIQIQPEPNVYGMYNPDGITTYTAGERHISLLPMKGIPGTGTDTLTRRISSWAKGRTEMLIRTSN